MSEEIDEQENIAPLQKRGAGRPKSDNPRTKTLGITLTQLELDTITNGAKRAGKMRVTWIRETVLAAAK